MKFEGKIRSFYDGENTEGEGEILLDGERRSLSFAGSASDRGATFVLDGEEVGRASDLHARLEEYFAYLWPDCELDAWEAFVLGDVVTGPYLAPPGGA